MSSLDDSRDCYDDNSMSSNKEMNADTPPDDDGGDCGMDGPPRRLRTPERRRLFPTAPRSRTRSSKGPSTPGSSPPPDAPPPQSDPKASTPRPSVSGPEIDPDKTLEYEDADFNGDSFDNGGRKDDKHKKDETLDGQRNDNHEDETLEYDNTLN